MNKTDNRNSQEYKLKRQMFNAYLQGKRDQIVWSTKWEDLRSVGKYRIAKTFLIWYTENKIYDKCVNE